MFTLPMKGVFYDIDSALRRITNDDTADDSAKHQQIWRAVANATESVDRDELVDLAYGFAAKYAMCRARRRR